MMRIVSFILLGSYVPRTNLLCVTRDVVDKVVEIVFFSFSN